MESKKEVKTGLLTMDTTISKEEVKQTTTELKNELLNQQPETNAEKRKNAVLSRLKRAFKDDSISKKKRAVNQISRKESKWYLDAEKPSKKTVEDKIEIARSRFGFFKPLSKSERQKRGKKFQKKADFQGRVLDEVEKYYSEREELFISKTVEINEKDNLHDSNETGSYLSEKTLLENNPLTQMAKDFHIYMVNNQEIGDKDLRDLMNYFASKSSTIESLRIRRCLEVIGTIDMSMFTYNSAEEFTQNLSKKMEALKISAYGDELLSQHEEQFKGINEIKAKIKVLNEIRKDYDSRIRLMQSPYYALLTKEELKKRDASEKLEGDGYLAYLKRDKAHLSEAVVTESYLKAVKDREEIGGFKRGDDSEKMYKKEVNAIYGDQVKEFKEIYGKLETGLKQRVGKAAKKGIASLNEKQLKDMVLSFYKDRGKELFPTELKYEDLKDYEFHEGTTLLGLEDEQRKQMLKLNTELIDLKSVNGKPVEISEEARAHLKEVMTEFTKLETEIAGLNLAAEEMTALNEHLDMLKGKTTEGKDAGIIKISKIVSDVEAELVGGYLNLLKVKRHELFYEFIRTRIKEGIIFGNSGDGREKDKYWKKYDSKKSELKSKIKSDMKMTCEGKVLEFNSDLFHITRELHAFNIESEIDFNLFKPGAEHELVPKDGIEKTLEAYEKLQEPMREFLGTEAVEKAEGQDFAGISGLEFKSYMEIYSMQTYEALKNFFKTVEIK